MPNRSLFTIGYLDYSREVSHVKFNVTPIDVTNYTAVNAALDTLRQKLDAIVLGSVNSADRILDAGLGGGTPPGDVNAQRERKWLLTLRDDVTNRKFKTEIPTAKLSGLLAPASDMADLTQTAWTDLATAIHAVVTSPDGNTVTLVAAKHVGKRL